MLIHNWILTFSIFREHPSTVFQIFTKCILVSSSFLLFYTLLPHGLLEDLMRRVGDSLVDLIVICEDSQGQHLSSFCLFVATLQSPFSAGVSGLCKAILLPSKQIHVMIQSVDLSIGITNSLTNEQLCGFGFFLNVKTNLHCSRIPLITNLFLSARHMSLDLENSVGSYHPRMIWSVTWQWSNQVPAFGETSLGFGMFQEKGQRHQNYEFPCRCIGTCGRGSVQCAGLISLPIAIEFTYQLTSSPTCIVRPWRFPNIFPLIACILLLSMNSTLSLFSFSGGRSGYVLMLSSKYQDSFTSKTRNKRENSIFFLGLNTFTDFRHTINGPISPLMRSLTRSTVE
uniref:Bilitranslocase n=1 Tax=Rattus norvegicus TaxID=10116 RepID=O88750_RAT|nr:bilitranslocase [Rattus norvegicus]